MPQHQHQEEARKLAEVLRANRPSTPPTPVNVEIPEGCSGYTPGYRPLAVVLHNVFSLEECDQLVRLGEGAGFEPALVNIGMGRQALRGDIRSSDRCLIDSPELAEEFWQRVKHAVPVPFKGFHAVGLNERLRALRYVSGQRFVPHMDGTFRRGKEAGDRSGELSLVTFHTYLTGGVAGGATRFLSQHKNGVAPLDVSPEPGKVVLFEHMLYHEGQEVTGGVKYTIRTDVMFTRKGPGFEYERLPITLGSDGKCTPSVFP